MRVYTTNDTWTMPAALLALDVLVRSPGGTGSGTVGGGGGAAIQRTRISPNDLPATATITVTSGGSETPTSFGDLISAQPGLNGANGGAGGLAPATRGGNGGAAGQPGQSVTSGVVKLLAAGGGGAGSGSTGGGSGLVPAGGTSPALWEWCQSGGGGNSGQTGGFPSGGGGAGAAGAAGVVVLIEYTDRRRVPTAHLKLADYGGFFGTPRCYQLSEPVTFDGQDYDHVVVVLKPRMGHAEAEVDVFPAGETGAAAGPNLKRRAGSFIPNLDPALTDAPYTEGCYAWALEQLGYTIEAP